MPDQAEDSALHARLERAIGGDVVVEDAYPLSPLQRAMLFHAIASDADDLYIVQQRIEIAGPLEFTSFADAWSVVVARHPALRTLFVWDEVHEPVQAVCRGLLPQVELRDLTDDEAAAATIASAFEADRKHRFKLDEPPLMRIILFRVSADHHVMLWSQHHLLQDGWSASNVLAEVFSAYDQLVAGATADTVTLAPVRPYVDFVEWIEARDPAEAESFWLTHFDGYERPTQIAQRSPSPDGAAYERRFRSLSSELTTELQAFAKTHALSLNTVLVGALAVTLGRHTGSGDVAFGVVAANRPPALEGVESMVGMFINTIVLRLEIDGAASVIDWLHYVQTRQSEVLQHQDSALTDIQRWSGLGTATTLTDTLFAYWSFGGEGTSPSGQLSYRTVDGYGRTSFPISVTVESADPINIGIDFDTIDLAIHGGEAFLEIYTNVLASIVGAPDRKVHSIEALGQADREELHSYNETAMAIPYGSIVDAFGAKAAETPLAMAVTAGGVGLSYAELDAASSRLAARIIQEGGFSARRVALLLPRSPEMVTAMLGVLKAGAAYVPIDRHLPLDRVAYILADSAADLVITTAELRDAVPGTGPPMIELTDEDAEWELDFDIPIGPSDSAYVMYTSGSTGKPKGVEISHEALINYVWWAHETYGHGKAVSFPLYTSPGFDLTVTSIYTPLVSGGEVVVYPDADERDLAVLDVFRDDSVDVVKLTPSHLAIIENEQLDTSRIATLILGGEDLRADEAKRVHDNSNGRIAVFNEYGPTEATVGCMIHRYDPAVDREASVPIGKPAANAHVYLLDTAHGPVVPGAIGELYVGGDGLAKGYLGRDDLTGQRFVPDPFRAGQRMYRTGDLATWRKLGVMEYAGRADEQIKVRGNRVEPGEIEAVLADHPAVVSAAVAVREPSPGDVRLVAYYVPSVDVAANDTELRDHLRARLPEFMVVHHLVRVDELPLTVNGKLDRQALPTTVGEVTTSTAYVEPRTQAERLVADLSAELLGASRVSIADNFFDLGGHSILAMQLIAKLNSATGTRVSPRIVLLNTLEQVAAQLPSSSQTALATSGEPAEIESQQLASSAFFFGPADSPLFGIHTSPASATRNGAVVICPPVGWDYMRTHWAMRKIARRLAIDGFHVLRFDYNGTGDSSGDREQATVERWQEDVATACKELSDISGISTVSIVGVRLGATLAAMANVAGTPADHLVMWDPIVSGATHLRQLEQMQSQMEFERGRRITPAMRGDELLGFPYPPARKRDLRAIDLTTIPWRATPTTLIATSHSGEFEELAAHVGSAMRLDHVTEDAAWDDLASSLGALLPVNVPGHIVTILGEVGVLGGTK